ncbi:MAG: diguanylate cyclase [Candidatus Omnitrophica bacterium]|nr:diguanylate cyclase [Candidatus Omnitrophota bacterium]
MENARAKRKAEILVVDDEQDMLKVLSMILSDAGYDVFTATSGKEALSKVEELLPDLIVLDIMMPDMDGMEVKTELNRNSFLSGIPVIFLTGLNDLSDKMKGFGFGIDDYITKPFESEELLARIASALDRRRYYEEISMTDGLTGLYNVHYFQKLITQLFNMARRYNSIFSLAVIDVDGLKVINDTYGHMVGSHVLKRIAMILQQSTRDADIVTRYGGDEFAVIFPETDASGSGQVIERLRDRINSECLSLKDKDVKIYLSVSIGISSYTNSIESEEQLFEKADANMYKEKNAKRGDRGQNDG